MRQDEQDLQDKIRSEQTGKRAGLTCGLDETPGSRRKPIGFRAKPV